jgi:dihydroorotate dehydrogenase
MKARRPLLRLYGLCYERLLRPLIFLRSPQAAHRDALRILAVLDRSAALCALARRLGGNPERDAVIPPFALAAGFVKGEGFADEAEALRAVAAGRNIVPGWRAMPALVGAVEFGSFTRYPRIGNPGVVMWREPATRSTQNRVGLRNPGARAAARFLGDRRARLPRCYGINIAVSPGVSDPAQEIAEVSESMRFFLDAKLRPAWFTLNLSCPNTEDDPSGNQTAMYARALCSALMAIPERGSIPLWIKIGPVLGAEQYAALMAVVAETGVAAIIATNTLARPVPASAAANKDRLTAGAGGGVLNPHALEAVRQLAEARERLRAPVRIIGCGGVLDGKSAHALRAAGADALQYWSALVYRGPLAASIIAAEQETNFG